MKYLDKAGLTYLWGKITSFVTGITDTKADQSLVNSIAGSIATIETEPATANHAVGEYVLYNGQLYAVTSAITAGASMSGKIARTSVGNELNNIAVVTGTLASSEGWSNYVSYPTGFTFANCTVLNFEVLHSSQWRSGTGINSATYTRTFVAVNSTGIRLYNSDSSLYGEDFRITLRKIY